MFIKRVKARGISYLLSTPVWSWTFPPVSCLTLWVGLHVGTSKFLAVACGALEVG
jgi:hypothetical protein